MSKVHYCNIWLLVFILSLSVAAASFAATFNVTRFDDPGPPGTCAVDDCSLREAVIAANANPGADTINLPSGTYNLSITGVLEDLALQGDLDITDTSGKTTIQGAGATGTIIDAGGMYGLGDRIFHVHPQAALEINYLTATNGYTTTQGGGVFNSGELNVKNSVLDSNQSDNAGPGISYGGGINNAGVLTITSSTLSNNSAVEVGGALHDAGTTTVIDRTIFYMNTARYGAGIYGRLAAMSITNSTFDQNIADTSIGCGGGINFDINLTITLDDNTFTANQAERGAGLCNYSTYTARRNTFTGNIANSQGGGVWSANDGVLTIEDSTISQNIATSRGGGIYARYFMFVRNSTVTGNEANRGGGIYSSDELTVTSSTISGNTANDDGGGIYNSYNLSVTSSTISSNTAEYGGGIYCAEGTDTWLTSSFVNNNRAEEEGGGIYVEYESDLYVTSSTLQGNQADYYGGGIYDEEDNDIYITNSLISHNSAREDGGGVYSYDFSDWYIDSCIIQSNTAGEDGGGIYNDNSYFIFRRSTISDNTAGEDGGGIWNDDYLIVKNSTISGNTAGEDGGGIWNADEISELYNSTISGNTAGDDGGGIYNTDEIYELYNSTISGNTAGDEGGGIANYYYIGELYNCTIHGNSAMYGGGVYNDDGIELENTIISGSPSGGDCYDGSSLSYSGENLIQDGTCSPDITGDPLLGPLADNGGWTFTHALLPGSPALDATGSGLDFDQRGVERHKGSDYDIGAYEASPVAYATITKTGTITTDGITYTIEVVNIGTETLYNAFVTDTPPFNLISVNVINFAPGPTCDTVGNTVTCDMGDMAPGVMHTFQIKTEYTPTSCEPIINYAYLITANIPMQTAHNVLYPLNCDSTLPDSPFTGGSKRNVPGNDPDVNNTGWTNGGSFIEGHNWGGLATPLSYTFTGTRIDVRANLGPLFGKVKIYIDGVFVGEIDLFSTDPATDEVIFSTLVGDGEHTIEIVPVASPPGVTVQITGFTIYN